MYKKPFFYLTIIFLSVTAFAFCEYVLAQDDLDGDTSEVVDDLNDEIKELEKRVAELQSKGKTLQNEIAHLDGQINLTQLKIRNAIAEIEKRTSLLAKLNVDIEKLGERIERLSESIEYQRRILGERMRARYKTRQESPIVMLFGSSTFSSLVKKSKYLKIMQIQDQRLLGEMEDTKKAYNVQKNLFEEKKQQTEELKVSVEAEKVNLEIYNRDLDEKRIERQVILNETQNDEEKYQEQLRKARAELEAIRNIVAAVDFKDGVEIEKGDVIAVMGNSGYPDCSDGPHLHFEIRKDGDVANAEGYLRSKNVYVYVSNTRKELKSIGDGSWRWPMKDPEITQRYGKTPWSPWLYPSGRHDGVDMVSGDTFIYAPKDGILVKGSMGCGGSVIKFAAIDHGDDVASYYLHVR